MVAVGETPGQTRVLREVILPRGFSARRVLALLLQAGFSPSPPEAEKRAGEVWWFDSQAGDLYRAHVQLRRLPGDRRWEWVEGSGESVSALDEAEERPRNEELEGRVLSLAARRRLLCCLKARMREDVWIFSDDLGGTLALGWVRWTFVDPHHPRRQVPGPRTVWWRGPIAEATRLSTAFSNAGLAPLPFNPLEAGLKALQRIPPGAPIPPEMHLLPGESVAKAGQKILSRQAFKMEANTEGTLLDLDPEFLHDLRVATRRARFALRLLGPVFGVSLGETLREELRWIAGLLGEVRDLDVFLVQVHEDLIRAQIAPEDGAWIADELARQRDQARRALVPALQSERFRSIVQALQNLEPPLLEPGTVEPDTPFVPPEAPAESVAIPMVQAAVRRVRKWRKRPLEELTPGDLHRLRIHFKRLRYTAEYFADLFDDDFRKGIRGLVPFQDALGAHQDAVVALARLKLMFENRSTQTPLTPSGLLAFGALLQVQRERALVQRAVFESLWPDFPRLAKKFL